MPFDLIFDNESLRILKLLKLVRLAKIVKFAQKIEDEGTVGPVVLQLTTLTMMTTFLAHILACMWFYTAVEAADQQKAKLVADGVEPVLYGDGANVKSWIYGCVSQLFACLNCLPVSTVCLSQLFACLNCSPVSTVRPSQLFACLN